MRVCLDAGHYGKYNRSPAVSEYWESEQMWKLHMLQKKYLEQYENVEVITTRSNKDVDRDLFGRGYASKGCDLFISDHSNAVGSGVNNTVDYVAVYHLYNDTTTRVDDISKEIAEKLAPVIASVIGTNQKPQTLSRRSDSDKNHDGMLNDNYYGVLNGSRQAGTPGILIEHSFHTNERIARWLMDDSNLDRLAKAEVEVLAEYFCLRKKGQNNSENNTSGSWYRVRKEWVDSNSQKGAFHDLTYAKKCADQNPGYFVFDEEGKIVYPEAAEPEKSEFKEYLVSIDIDNLRIRKGPGTDYESHKMNGKDIHTGPGIFTIVAESDGQGASKWGLLKAYQDKRDGWISLNFAKKI